jgi:hypothetical protein
MRKLWGRDLAPSSIRWTNSSSKEVRIGANHLTLIRSILIDFDHPQGSSTVVCAKNFQHTDVLPTNSGNANRGACDAQYLSPNCFHGVIPPTKKTLFHRAFLHCRQCARQCFLSLLKRAKRCRFFITSRRERSMAARIHVSLSGNVLFSAVL